MRKIYNIVIALIMCLFCAQAQKTFTVVIDAGHGGKDPGASGSISKEKSINLAVALKLGSLITENNKNVKVVYTRKKDVFIPLDERANIANKSKADLFISIHCNSVKKNKRAYGTETYTIGLANSDENLDVAMRENSVILMEDDYLQKYEGFDPKSSESYIIFEFIQNKNMEQSVSFASEIQKSFVRAKRLNRGIKQGGLLVLRKSSMPSVLIEVGFISNREEEKYMASEEGQKALAQAIYNAFDKFKNNYDRKLGNIKDKNVSTPKETEKTSNISKENTSKKNITITRDNDKNSGFKTTSSKNKDGIIYKIQILTSDKKLSTKDKEFKGYDNISFYKDRGIYKYTYGETDDYSKILRMYKKATKDFKGSFIIKMQNGQRIN